jgi:hypothetical protein
MSHILLNFLQVPDLVEIGSVCTENLNPDIVVMKAAKD